MSKEPVAPTTPNTKLSWLSHGAEFLTIFFALALLAGWVYAKSYWNSFGLSPELVGTSVINYAIISPNTAIASALMAAGTVAMLALLRRQFPDLLYDHHLKAASWIGGFALLAGITVASVIPQVNTSSWPAGTAGLAFGIGYLFVIGGFLVIGEAGNKLDRMQSKPPSRFIIWLKKYLPVKFAVIEIIFMVCIAAASLWGILETAREFGVNEAAMFYDTRTIVTIRLDSQEGFEDLVYASSSNGSALVQAKIITETGGFLYVSPGVTKEPPQLYVRAIPVSRVQEMQYKVNITLPGK